MCSNLRSIIVNIVIIDFIMKDILPIPMQCKQQKNESVSCYTLHAGASTNYILISILKYLLDFTSLQVKSYK